MTWIVYAFLSRTCLSMRFSSLEVFYQCDANLHIKNVFSFVKFWCVLFSFDEILIHLDFFVLTRSLCQNSFYLVKCKSLRVILYKDEIEMIWSRTFIWIIWCRLQLCYWHTRMNLSSFEQLELVSQSSHASFYHERIAFLLR